ncbi:TraG family conjugative transposon ATPase [Niabella sp. CJ426]|uniref:TraG family conjugative transposon ATPase n=1 Tax=Niabella sp. CJ426 TaxID=3393740 RepID=UPI003D01A2D6
MKQKKLFKEPFIGTSQIKEMTLVHSNNGNYSAIIAIQNNAQQYAGDPEAYEIFHTCFGQIIKLLADNYILQKTDIVALKTYKENHATGDYLQEKYFQHFQGRKYRDVLTYVTITKQNKKQKFFSYSEKDTSDFYNNILKVIDTLNSYGLQATLLTKEQIDLLHRAFLAFNFSGENYALGNIACDANGLEFGDNAARVISIVDPEYMNLPNQMTIYKSDSNSSSHLLTDNFSFLLNVPEADTVLYNQVVFIPDQTKIKKEMELKKKRHSSMPDPENKLSVGDIEDMFVDVAQNNELVVKAHFSIIVSAPEPKIAKVCNNIDTQLFGLGIIPGRNTYNQMELFRAAIPGNADELKVWDKFTVSRPAALCFFFKESLIKTEDSDYLIYFTDRQGIPCGIDTSEKVMQNGRINSRNRFVLGPSGSGKSFLMNSYLKQTYDLGADIIIVDTGHSYSGICSYVGGKYITYREDKPITMNPFKIEPVENTEEKREMLKSLMGLIWKGAEGSFTQVEDSVLSKCISDYYAEYFGKRETVTELNFNSFFDFSCKQIELLVNNLGIKFDYHEYQFILRKFYRGGQYDTILNDDFDNTLFNERFIVFEIDSIKESKLLFPITTLIIMDVYLQKMRYKKCRKLLVVEEAWKAIATKLMAGYLVYQYKTGRKFNGETIVVTQELDDIIGNEVVKNSIIANSDTIFLLDQSKFKESFTGIAQLLSITEIERRKIFTINKLDNRADRGRFKEFYARRGMVGEVYGLEVSLEEYMAFTTERPEKEAFEIYLREHGQFIAAMDSFIADYKNQGDPFPKFIKAINASGQILNLQKETI